MARSPKLPAAVFGIVLLDRLDLTRHGPGPRARLFHGECFGIARGVPKPAKIAECCMQFKTNFNETKNKNSGRRRPYMSPSAFRAESSKHKMTWDNPGLNKIVGALRWADSIPCCPKRVANPELNHRQYPLFLYKRFPSYSCETAQQICDFTFFQS